MATYQKENIYFKFLVKWYFNFFFIHLPLQKKSNIPSRYKSIQKMKEKGLTTCEGHNEAITVSWYYSKSPSIEASLGEKEIYLL